MQKLLLIKIHKPLYFVVGGSRRDASPSARLNLIYDIQHHKDVGEIMCKSNVKIGDNKIVKSYLYGSNLEMTTANGLQNQVIRVIGGKRYVVLETGEIFDMDIGASSRQDNIISVKRTMTKLRRLIAHNFFGAQNELWITLTYRDHITDSKKAYVDFKLFMKKLKYKYSNTEYISVIEPQLSGRWHFHILLKKTDVKRLRIENEIIEKLWGKGFVKTKRLKSSDHVGNYLIAYLTNLKIGDEFTDKETISKGARLYLYPKGIRIYRRSKGIVDPIEETSTKKELIEKYHLEDKEADFSKYTEKQIPTSDKKISYTTEIYNNVTEILNKNEPAIQPTKADDKPLDM